MPSERLNIIVSRGFLDLSFAFWREFPELAEDGVWHFRHAFIRASEDLGSSIARVCLFYVYFNLPGPSYSTCLRAYPVEVHTTTSCMDLSSPIPDLRPSYSCHVLFPRTLIPLTSSRCQLNFAHSYRMRTGIFRDLHGLNTFRDGNAFENSQLLQPRFRELCVRFT